MTLNELYDELLTLNVPVAYSHFLEKQETPFIVYIDTDSDNFGADNIVYNEARNIDVEIYSETINIDLENRLKELFTRNQMYYEWSRNYLTTEKVYQTTFEVII